MSLATIQDVAARAQVSVGTVSRVINGSDSVRPPTRAAVLAAIDELGYRPNPHARNLRTDKSRTIAMLLPNLHEGMLAAIGGAEQVARAHGYALHLVDTHHDKSLERTNLEVLIDRHTDGILCCPVASTAEVAELVNQARVPTVAWGQCVADDCLPSVIVDETPAVTRAIQSLANFGHQDIGIVLAPAAGSSFAHDSSRTRAFIGALESTNLVWNESLRIQATNPSDCAAEVRSLLETSPTPSALLVGSHSLLPSAIRAIHESGRRIPDDLSLVGFGDSQWALAFDPPISAIAMDLAYHVRRAAELLFELLSGKEAPTSSVIDFSEFHQRRSIGPAPLISP